ncbi:MAG: GatB/YqeY domain-containing protein [Chloroflexota bacterium]|jgi:uncharacterized protein YqeY|nr:GatB/YqeY domain-containing protein [Chloroflexota bacterium]
MTEAQLSLAEQIDRDLKQAMRERDDVAKLTLRSVKTALTEAAKSGQQHALSEEDVLAVIQREAKQRRETAQEYERLGAQEQAANELAELAVLEHYLPQQLTAAEIEEIVRNVIAETGASSPREMGRVMSAAMERLKGVADGKVVNQIARRLLDA